MKIFKRFERKYPYLHALIVGAALIMLWRGLWGLMDKYLFPHNEPLSYIISLALGLLLLILDDVRLRRIG